MDGIIERLKRIGLNSYEAKVYLALVKNHPATGYEVSKESGIPQARAYDTLKSLEAQKMVVATGSKPVTYLPVPPEDVLNRFEKQYQESINYLRDTLPNYAVESIEPVHTVRGEDGIYKHARQMIEEARETIFLEMWGDDAYNLEDALRDAANRGVNVHVVGYHKLNWDFCHVHDHSLAETIESSLGGRWIIMAVDSNCGLVGTYPQDANEPHAIWTKNPALVLVIKELVVHDIFILDVEKTVPEALEKAYGSGMFKLRRKIFGNELLIGAH